jgi:N-acetylmuramoyl-L-alanine amidase
VLCECACLTNAAEARNAATASYGQRIAHGIARGILEEEKLGDAGIAPVPEIWAPLSRGSDRHAVHGSHRHVRKKTRST